jgi:HSP20 family protein
MALIRWEPVAELNTIQNEMNRLFNTFFDQPGQTGRGNGTMRRWLPPMDLVETPDHYVLRADLPGLSDGDVNVQLEANVLTISGERKAEHEDQQEGYYRLERPFGAFSRSLTLPDGVDPDGIQAHFDRGVLEIRVPKPEQKKPKTVQITLGTNPDTKTIESADAEPSSRDPVAVA